MLAVTYKFIVHMMSSMLSHRSETRRTRGFTLIELMTVISIIAILMLLAAPSFVTFKKNSELTSTINNLASSFNAARTEALRSGKTTTVVPAASGWAGGWTALRSDTTVIDKEYLSAPPTGISPDLTFTTPTVTSGTALSALPTTGVQFSGDGYPQQVGGSGPLNGALQLTNQIRQRQLQLAPTGQVKVCDPAAASNTSGACS